MAIEWRESLETGIEAIDLQHKELFARFNSMLEACNRGEGRDEVLRLLLFLDDYIKSHFAEEEELQAHYRYPGYHAHKEQHGSFISKIEQLKREFSTEGTTIFLVVQTNRTLVEWLIQHIGKLDKEFAGFVKGRP